jgi:carbon monoxide dehydrogenase subunit G
VGDGSTTKATVTNTRKRGSIMVTKVVDWNGITPDENQAFQICITGPSHPQSDCQAVGYQGGPVMWYNLIPGDYTVSESALGSEWMVTIDDTDVTVLPDGSTATASVINVRKLGILDVVKVVDWHGVTPDEGQEFRICISGPSFPTGDCKTADYDGTTLTWDSLIPGEYTVYEENPGAEWTVTVDASNVYVSGNGMVTTAGVTNTRKRGSLTINKVADWNGIEPDTTKTFLICITGPSFPSGDCKATDFDGGALLWEELIPGSYSVSEQNPGAEWNVQVKDSPALVPIDGSSAAASVLNTRKLGSLQVTKTVNWNGVPPIKGQSFTICIAGPSFTNSDCKNIGPNGGKLTWNDLIPGVYEVTENSPGSTWTVLITGSPATVPVTGGRAEVTVANTKQPPARITVTKAVTETQTPEWSFVFKLDGARSQTVTEKQPTATWENLESSRTYVLSEMKPGAPWVEGEFQCRVNGVAVGDRLQNKAIRLTPGPGDHVICVKYNDELTGIDNLEPEDEPQAGFSLYLPSVKH